jgi:5'-nucleotidase
LGDERFIGMASSGWLHRDGFIGMFVLAVGQSGGYTRPREFFIPTATSERAMAEKLLRCVLLTNDDGIDEPGLSVLEEVAAGLAEEVWVVAPERDQSGVSAAISLHQPIRVRRHGPRRFAVAGTPNDCVIMAVRHLMGEQRPDLVLSGINSGANLGDDVVFSGTVSAAMTGLFHGLPSIALSQSYRDRKSVPWETAAAWTPRVVQTLLSGGWPANACYNVNFPDVPPDEVAGIEAVRQSRGAALHIGIDAREDTRGKDYYWLSFRRDRQVREPDTDIAALCRRAVAITPIRFDRTDNDALDGLRDLLRDS